MEGLKVEAIFTLEIGKDQLERAVHLKASPIGAATSPTSGSLLAQIERLHRDLGDRVALGPASDQA